MDLMINRQRVTIADTAYQSIEKLNRNRNADTATEINLNDVDYTNLQDSDVKEIAATLKTMADDIINANHTYINVFKTFWHELPMMTTDTNLKKIQDAFMSLMNIPGKRAVLYSKISDASYTLEQWTKFFNDTTNYGTIVTGSSSLASAQSIFTPQSKPAEESSIEANIKIIGGVEQSSMSDEAKITPKVGLGVDLTAHLPLGIRIDASGVVFDPRLPLALQTIDQRYTEYPNSPQIAVTDAQIGIGLDGKTPAGDKYRGSLGFGVISPEVVSAYTRPDEHTDPALRSTGFAVDYLTNSTNFDLGAEATFGVAPFKKQMDAAVISDPATPASAAGFGDLGTLGSNWAINLAFGTRIYDFFTNVRASGGTVSEAITENPINFAGIDLDLAYKFKIPLDTNTDLTLIPGAHGGHQWAWYPGVGELLTTGTWGVDLEAGVKYNQNDYSIYPFLDARYSGEHTSYQQDANRYRTANTLDIGLGVTLGLGPQYSGKRPVSITLSGGINQLWVNKSSIDASSITVDPATGEWSWTTGTATYSTSNYSPLNGKVWLTVDLDPVLMSKWFNQK